MKHKRNNNIVDCRTNDANAVEWLRSSMMMMVMLLPQSVKWGRSVVCAETPKPNNGRTDGRTDSSFRRVRVRGGEKEEGSREIDRGARPR